MKKGKGLKSLSFIVAVIFILMTFAGCGTSEQKGNEQSIVSNGSETENQQTTKEKSGDLPIIDVRVGVAFTSAELLQEASAEKDRILKYIQDKFKFNLSFVSGADDYIQKMQLEMSTGQAPDIMQLPLWSGGDTLYWDCVKQGLFLDLGEYVEKDPDKYSVLALIFKDPYYAFLNETKNGGADKYLSLWNLGYGINAWGAPLFNNRYLKALNLKVPTTVDEFVEVLRAIKKGDPDGNGKVGDVIPWSFNTYKGTYVTQLDVQQIFFNANGTHPDGFWQDENGKWMNYAISDKNKDIWKLLASMYQEGLIDKEVFTREAYANVDLMAAGKLACATFGLPNFFPSAYTYYFSKIKSGIPDATIDDFVMPEEPLKGSAGYAKSFVNPVSAPLVTCIPKSTKNPERVVEFLNWIASDEGQTTIWYGVEGIHYSKKADGSMIFDLDEYLKECNLYNTDMTRSTWDPMCYLVDSITQYVQYEKAGGWTEGGSQAVSLTTERQPKTAEFLYASRIIKKYKEVAELIPFYKDGVILTDDEKAIKSKLDDINRMYFTSFILGEKTVDKDWNAFVQEVKNAGSDKIVAEYEKQYPGLEAKYKK